jgi:hypothetical protein
VRKYTWEGTFEYLENGGGFLETRNVAGRFLTNCRTATLICGGGGRSLRVPLAGPSPCSPGHTIPRALTVSTTSRHLWLRAAARLSGSLSLQAGEFYDGNITALTYSSGRFAILKQWSLEPSFGINHVTLPSGDFTSQVYRARTDYGFSPRRFISALVQYSSADNIFQQQPALSVGVSARQRAVPVYTDERDTTTAGYPGLRNRAFVVKVTRLFQFSRARCNTIAIAGRNKRPMNKALDFLSGGGRAGEVMRGLDWSSSPLGAPQFWPQSLRSIVGLMLQSQFRCSWRGDRSLDSSITIRTRTFSAPSIRAPWVSGFQDIWSEIWTDISPLIDAALAGQRHVPRRLAAGDDPERLRRGGPGLRSPTRQCRMKAAGLPACSSRVRRRPARSLSERALRESEARLRELNETLGAPGHRSARRTQAARRHR